MRVVAENYEQTHTHTNGTTTVNLAARRGLTIGFRQYINACPVVPTVARITADPLLYFICLLLVFISTHPTDNRGL